MPQALITGITGQDGAYLARSLIGKGYRVHGVVRENTESSLAGLEHLSIVESVGLIPANLLDIEALTRVLNEIAPDEVYNLAAESSVARSFEQPVDTYRFNTLSTLNLLEAIRSACPRARLYQASSSEMFGNAESLPITEQSTPRPISPYGASKAAAHQLAAYYRESHGLHCWCGIMFNHESALRPPHFVTKKIVSAAVRISRGAREELRLGNLDIRRDWGYAPNYVEAMWTMLQQDAPADYVICSGEANSLEAFVEKAFACLDLDWRDHIVIDETLRRPADIDVIFGDSRKAGREIGWTNGRSFEKLVEQLVDDELAL